MQLQLINDWQFLFKGWALGGRFASFAFITVTWLSPKFNTEDIQIGGLTLVVLGLGVRISPKGR